MDNEGWAILGGIVGTGFGILVGARLKFFYDSKLRREADRRAQAEPLFVAFSELREAILEDHQWELEELGNLEYGGLWKAWQDIRALAPRARMLGASFFADYKFSVDQCFDFAHRMSEASKPKHVLTPEEEELLNEIEERDSLLPDGSVDIRPPFDFTSEQPRALESVNRCLVQLREVLAL